MSSYKAVKIEEKDGAVSIEIDGVPLSNCTGFVIARDIESITKVTFSILARDITLVSDKAEPQFIDVATIQDRVRKVVRG